MNMIVMTKAASVGVFVVFSLLFCVVTFAFATIQTDHKLVLVFAYASIMATIFSAINNNNGGSSD